MPLIGNTMNVLGEDNYIHIDDMKKGTITATKGDYFVIISFNRVVTREEIEQCCSVTDQDGQKLSYGVLIGRGSTSLLGYYVSPKGRGPKLVFRDNDASVDLKKLMK